MFSIKETQKPVCCYVFETDPLNMRGFIVCYQKNVSNTECSDGE